MHRQRQAPARGRRIALSLAMNLFSFESTGAGGDPQGGCPAPTQKAKPARAASGKRSAEAARAGFAIVFGVQGCTSTPSFPVPVGNTGTDFQKSR